jgi:hypothetical protein
MANSCRIMSWLNGLVMDVYEGLAEPRTHVQTYTPNMPISPNQLWTFEPGPESTPGFYYIKSNLGSNLVLDAYESTPQPGLPPHFLQLYTPNSPASPNQLWKFVPLSPAAPLPQGFIQSLLPNLVADIPHADKNPGTLLQAWPQDSPTSANQLWGLLPYPGYSYDPQISSIIPAGQGHGHSRTNGSLNVPAWHGSRRSAPAPVHPREHRPAGRSCGPPVCSTCGDHTSHRPSRTNRSPKPADRPGAPRKRGHPTSALRIPGKPTFNEHPNPSKEHSPTELKSIKPVLRHEVHR